MKDIQTAKMEMGVSPIWGYHYRDLSILGSILGSPYFGKLPNAVEAGLL